MSSVITIFWLTSANCDSTSLSVSTSIKTISLLFSMIEIVCSVLCSISFSTLVMSNGKIVLRDHIYPRHRDAPKIGAEYTSHVGYVIKSWGARCVVVTRGMSRGKLAHTNRLSVCLVLHAITAQRDNLNTVAEFRYIPQLFNRCLPADRWCKRA